MSSYYHHQETEHDTCSDGAKIESCSDQMEEENNASNIKRTTNGDGNQQLIKRQKVDEMAEDEKENQKLNIDENSQECKKADTAEDVHGEERHENCIEKSKNEASHPSAEKCEEPKKASEKKIQNLRKNIKELLDESQLDSTTLAAQRLELERLARLQETQRIVRENQRQIAAEKQANRTQQKVLSLLGDSKDESIDSAINFKQDPILEKLSLTTAYSGGSATIKAPAVESLIQLESKSSDSDGDSDDDVIIQSEEQVCEKSKAVHIVDSSSDSDDCIILSDEEDDDDGDLEEDENNSGEHTNDLYNQPDAEGRVVVNIGHSEKENDIFIAPQIACVIKPHQIGGVRFLFDNIIESTELFEKSTGFGCILAHSMGLGKTLQLVCFCDIFLRHTNSKTVLIIMPINTLQNWMNEFNLWLPLSPENTNHPPYEQIGVRPRNFKIHVLNDSHKSLNVRAKVIFEWKNEGGVLMMGYEMFRLLSLKKIKQKKRKESFQQQENDVSTSSADKDLFDKIYEALVNPGADLVVCDEGHRIKNASASTSIALKQIKTKRRIVLTGYPLQNNLLEYWCMVDFVRPSYLGTKTEFSNMFERPIQNGQCIDSTPQDCKLMRYRAHVLHSLLKGFVQRRSHDVLQKCLPNKTEHVLLVRMTPFQRKLYTTFMNEVVRSKKVPNPLKAFAVCCKIWNHPDVLHNFLKKKELDLEIELDETEVSSKSNSTTSSVSKKRNGTNKKEITKLNGKERVPSQNENRDLSPVKLEKANIMQSSSVDASFKPPITPLSNDSAYSSNQSTSNTFDTSINCSNNYFNYQNYEGNPYQNYNYNVNPNNATGYQNWNGASNYWQNNYYHSEYFPANNYHAFYGNQNASQNEQYKMPQNNIVNNADGEKLNSENKIANEGGLLADVIQKETKEQQEKLSTNKDESSEITISKSSRDDGIPYDWAIELMKDYVPDLIENSPKMEIFFCILEESIALGDRLLVFSQSLLTLNLLERFLQRRKIPNSPNYWSKNQSYFRLDGSTSALEREKLINEFNGNLNFKLFLVSTRAGSLGINLVGANRVIVFDASWNPCHDTQAVCRVYRYGQVKSCFVYRLVVDNCLEKKIYDRQINKQGMADRVVDECNPDAHLSLKEVTSLCYDDGEDPEMKDLSIHVTKYEDVVIQKILANFSKTLTKEPFHHESLLIDRKEKKLSQAEKRLAQRGYEMEKQAASKTTFNSNNSNSYRLFRTPDGTLIQRPIISTNRPMQPLHGVPQMRPSNPAKPNRWVPVEVWQSKGITAQEMTLPQDVSIQTNSADKSKIFLRAGQKVIVLKSPRGICLQLESGKVIAIRASLKGQAGTPSIGSLINDDSDKISTPATSESDIIDMTNDEDDEELLKKVDNSKSFLPSSLKNEEPSNDLVCSEKTDEMKVPQAKETLFKEKPIVKPNLVSRKQKLQLPQTNVPTSENISCPEENNLLSQNKMSWNNYAYRDANGNSKNDTLPFRNSYTGPNDNSNQSREHPTGSSAFHAPSSNYPYHNSFMQSPLNYPTHDTYTPSPNYQYPHNYNYYSPAYTNTSRNYNYSQSYNYDPQYSYQHGYNQYNQLPTSNVSNPYPSLTQQPPCTSASTENFSQWSYK